MDHAVVGRIGRAPRPGEAALQRLRERPDVLEYMAQTAFAGELSLTPLAAEAQWAAMPEADRATWIDRTFASIAEGAGVYDASLPVDPPEPGGGGQGQVPDAPPIAASA
jgi:hypothetical protein